MSAFKDFDTTWVMVVDIDKCSGCGACMAGCQTENNIAPQPDGSNKLRTVSWMTVYELSNKKPFPNHDMAFLPRPCMQCGNPPCVSVCPVIATDKNEDGGIVSQIYPRCIGCRYCVGACPYHARVFGWYDPVWPEGMQKTLTPLTSVRPRGVVEKCNFCHHRLNLARDAARAQGNNPNDLPDGAYVPACAEICPTGAISFGDANNAKHQVHEMIKSPKAFRLLEKLGTKPQVYYYSEREWVRRQGDNYLKSEKV